MNHIDEVRHELHNHHHPKVTGIIVNGREKEVIGREVTFAEIVRLSGLPGGPNVTFTVTYNHAEEPKRGTLIEGETVCVKTATVFNVTRTNKS